MQPQTTSRQPTGPSLVPSALRRLPLLPRRPPLARGVSMNELLRFQALMAGEGQTVQLARMCYDRPYAFDCIACAHASANDPLRRLALQLFKAYEQDEGHRQLLA
ncbi:MAG: hypothetical protein J0M20_05795 [Burkholderiales bacterium]|nr:hypothetical protein [Burkholderiales bacterium]